MVGTIIDIVAILIIIIAAFVAYKKGFVKTFFGFISTIIAIVLAFSFYKLVATYLINNTEIGDVISNNITSMFNISGENTIIKVDDNTSKIIENLPEAVNQFVDFEEIKQNTVQTIGEKLAVSIINILAWIIIYVIVRLVLWIVIAVLDGIMQLPFLKEINNLSGLVLGALMGLFRIYLILAMIYFVTNIANIEFIIEGINTSTLVSGMYYNNLLISLIF